MKIRLSELRRIIAEEVEAALDEASVAPQSLKTLIRYELGGQLSQSAVDFLTSKLITISKKEGMTEPQALLAISKDKDLPLSPGRPDREKILMRLVKLLDLPEKLPVKYIAKRVRPQS
jgi:hypothetical protein